jgi:hypothetical protein
MVYIGVSCVRYVNNNITKGEYNVFLSQLILLMLMLALVWTYLTLTMSLLRFFTQKMQDREEIVVKIFEETDLCDVQVAAVEEDIMIKKLMKRFERVELQYNVHEARNELLSGYEEILRNKPMSAQNDSNNLIDEAVFA